METNTDTTRKVDLTDGRDTVADLRTKIAEARQAMTEIDWSEIHTDADLLDELGYLGVNIVTEQEPDGIQFVSGDGWAGDTTTKFEAWATVTAWQAQHEDGSGQWYTETTDGVTVVEGEEPSAW